MFELKVEGLKVQPLGLRDETGSAGLLAGLKPSIEACKAVQEKIRTLRTSGQLGLEGPKLYPIPFLSRSTSTAQLARRSGKERA